VNDNITNFDLRQKKVDTIGQKDKGKKTSSLSVLYGLDRR